MAKLYALLLLGIVLLGVLTCSQMVKTDSEPNPPENPSDLSFLTQALQELEKEAIFRPARIGLSIRRCKNHELVFSHGGQKTMVPASGQKAITCATALGILGEDFRFQTQIQHDGAIREGVLQGNIYLVGGGDPSLGSRYLKLQNLDLMFAQWLRPLQDKGIRQVKGHIIADESAFFGDINPADWMWGDMGNYFGAPAGGLNVLDNAYMLLFQPGTVGQVARISGTQPADIPIQFINEVLTGPAGSGDQASISGAPYDLVRYVSGTVPAGGTFKIRGSIPDPGVYLAQRFQAYLKKVGISVEKDPSSSRLWKLKGKSLPGNRTLLHRHPSYSLSKLIRPTNQYSINLYAEAILQALAIKSLGTSHTLKGGEAIQSYWQAKGLDTEGLYIRDGSGLSRSNGISPDQFSHILSLITQEPYFDSFYRSLPVAGVSGTMARIGIGTVLRNNLRAKSGSMSRVVSFSGYFKSLSGKDFSFSLIVNGHTSTYGKVRDKLSNLMLLMLNIP